MLLKTHCILTETDVTDWWDNRLAASEGLGACRERRGRFGTGTGGGESSVEEVGASRRRGRTSII
jgi:hypothetical protein